jgi:MoaA/NifB/PqqE/SkfB family radical SAM enzyme
MFSLCHTGFRKRVIVENKIPKCIVPWLYLEIFPDGIVTPCCANDFPLGSIKKTSLDQIWNGKHMNEFRLSLLKDDLPPSCISCEKIEKLKGISLRQKYNNFFKDSFSYVLENTNKDGSLKKIQFKGWDFKVSNKCNFKCRMCSPRLSSQFTGKILEHSASLDINSFVEDNIEHFELIEFAGGETLLMDEQYELLKKLIEKGKTNIELWYNTNMSVLSYKKHQILEYWNKWNPEKLTVFASIDEIENRSEYIRKGTKWKIIDENLKIIANQKFNISTNITVSCLNVFRLPEIIQYLVNIGYINKKFSYNNFDLSIIDGATELGIYGIDILPKKFKNKIKEKLISFIDEYNLKYKTDVSNKFKPILNSLDLNMNKDNVKLFLQKNKMMDIERNENLLENIPEFKLVFLEWKNILQSHQ